MIAGIVIPELGRLRGEEELGNPDCEWLCSRSRILNGCIAILNDCIAILNDCIAILSECITILNDCMPFLMNIPLHANGV